MSGTGTCTAMLRDLIAPPEAKPACRSGGADYQHDWVWRDPLAFQPGEVRLCTDCFPDVELDDHGHAVDGSDHRSFEVLLVYSVGTVNNDARLHRPHGELRRYLPPEPPKPMGGWADGDTEQVKIARNREKRRYHTDPECRKWPTGPHFMTEHEAEERGYVQCKWCAGDVEESEQSSLHREMEDMDAASVGGAD